MSYEVTLDPRNFRVAPVGIEPTHTAYEAVALAN